MNRQSLQRNAIFAGIGASLLAAFAYFGPAAFATGQAGATQPPVAAQAPQPVPAAPVSAGPFATDFSGIVERFGPAVVNISVIGKVQRVPATLGFPGIDPNDPFYEFFRRFGPQFPRVPQEQPVIRGQGSGFIVSQDGLILTNAHVIDGAQDVLVKLTDRREYRAKVLGVDRQTDIAVIRIEAKGLPAVKLGDPEMVKVGEPVLAIGSPFGFENTATSGIVSAKSRSLPNDAYVPFIQTDVAVNPGNSGGPLFNIRGEVIGINSQIYSRTGGFQGLSFAIPIDVASRVQEQLVKSGKVTRGRLGVSIQEVDQALAESFKLAKPQGALVSGVERGGPAERAGLQPGDIIVRIDGDDIRQTADLPIKIASLKPGSQARLEVIRDGTARTIQVTIGEQRDRAVAS